MRAELYYHEKKKDYLILRKRENGISGTSGFTNYRSIDLVFENPKKYGWKFIGFLKWKGDF